MQKSVFYHYLSSGGNKATWCQFRIWISLSANREQKYRIRAITASKRKHPTGLSLYTRIQICAGKLIYIGITTNCSLVGLIQAFIDATTYRYN
jgi:hypothetical protein